MPSRTGCCAPGQRWEMPSRVMVGAVDGLGSVPAVGAVGPSPVRAGVTGPPGSGDSSAASMKLRAWSAAAIPSAVLFAVLHLNPAMGQNVFYLCLGLLACVAYWWTGALTSAVWGMR